MTTAHYTERQIRDALDDVVRRFTQANPDNEYGYKLARLLNVSNGTNWAVTHVGRFIGGSGAFVSALDDVHRSMPLMYHPA